MSKPKVQLSGTDSNVFSLLARCTQALKRSKQFSEANELSNKVFECGSYHEALVLMMDYVNVS